MNLHSRKRAFLKKAPKYPKMDQKWTKNGRGHREMGRKSVLNDVLWSLVPVPMPVPVVPVTVVEKMADFQEIPGFCSILPLVQEENGQKCLCWCWCRWSPKYPETTQKCTVMFACAHRGYGGDGGACGRIRENQNKTRKRSAKTTLW